MDAGEDSAVAAVNHTKYLRMGPSASARTTITMEAVFVSRSWRIGFALTRLWRTLVPLRKETAADR
jgi:hypothetical protein